MTESDNESRLDEMERDSLQKAISEVERVIATSTPGTNSSLKNFLENAKGRVATLDKKIKESRAARETREKELASVASLAQREAALSASEKETYSGFLGKEFFTRKDFGSLEQFYAHTWDRLSESGKDEMSHRIWEGVRRGEYEFGELPKTVREKETERAYSVLGRPEAGTGVGGRVPEKDREDFIRLYESGNRGEAEKILERDCFKDHMFRGAKPEANAAQKQEVLQNAAATGAPIQKPTSSPDAGKANTDLSALELNGVKLTESSGPVSSPQINSAIAKTARVSGKSFV